MQVINSGVPGNNTAELLARFDEAVAAHAPDLVILMAGTNDALNSGKPLPLTVTRENFRLLLKKIAETGAKTLAMTIPDANPEYLIARHRPGFFDAEPPREKIAAVNRMLRETAAEWIDLNARLGVSDERMESNFANPANSGCEDGVHLTEAGYRVIAEAVAEAIRIRNWNPERIVCFGDSLTFGKSAPPGKSYPDQLQLLLGGERENRHTD